METISTRKNCTFSKPVHSHSVFKLLQIKLTGCKPGWRGNQNWSELILVTMHRKHLHPRIPKQLTKKNKKTNKQINQKKLISEKNSVSHFQFTLTPSSHALCTNWWFLVHANKQALDITWIFSSENNSILTVISWKKSTGKVPVALRGLKRSFVREKWLDYSEEAWKFQCGNMHRTTRILHMNTVIERTQKSKLKSTRHLLLLIAAKLKA